MTQYSMDPALKEVVFTAMFLEDGWVATIFDFETHGRVYVGGDIVEMERDGRQQQAVVFGVGGE